MKTIAVGICALTPSVCAFGQGDRGTITGTIADPAGPVVAGTKVEAKQAENRSGLSGRQHHYVSCQFDAFRFAKNPRTTANLLYRDGLEDSRA